MKDIFELLKNLLGRKISFTAYFRWTGYHVPKEKK